MNELFIILEQHGLLDNAGNIILEQYGNGQYQAVDQATFTLFFGDVEVVTYETLSGEHTFIWNDETLTRTASELGYQRYFDEWKEIGILN